LFPFKLTTLHFLPYTVKIKKNKNKTKTKTKEKQKQKKYKLRKGQAVFFFLSDKHTYIHISRGQPGVYFAPCIE